MAQEIEDNYEHFDYIIDFVPPTAYVLPRRRRVARCALRGEHATSTSSSIHERIEFVVYNRIVRSPRLYGIYAVRRRRGSRLEPLSARTVPPVGVAGASAAVAEGVRKLRLTVESIRSCTRRMRIQPHHEA
jgi:hypothetical protein